MSRERALAFLDDCCEVMEHVNQINQAYKDDAEISFYNIHIPLGKAEKVALAAQKTIRYVPSDYGSEVECHGLVFFSHEGVNFYGGYY